MQDGEENQRFIQRFYSVIFARIKQYHGVWTKLMLLAVTAGKVPLPLQNNNVHG